MLKKTLTPVCVLALIGFSGCANSPTSQERTTLDIYAAASLGDAFKEIADLFGDTHPDVRLVVNLAGSATLAQQIAEGAPADLVALADSQKMDTLAAAKNVEASSVVQFARNSLTVVVQRGNPKGISNLSDLAKNDIVAVLCDVVQPCGANAEVVLKKVNVALSPASRESNVNGVVQRVSSGEADAGIVYVTDAQAHGDTLESVAIPAEVNVINSYPIAIVSNISSRERKAAQEFIEFITGEGSAVLTRLGFMTP